MWSADAKLPLFLAEASASASFPQKQPMMWKLRFHEEERKLRFRTPHRPARLAISQFSILNSQFGPLC